MIKIKKVDKSFFELYDKVPQNVEVHSELRLRMIDGGLGGMKDACVLWDIRVDDKYKHQGIGQKLFDQAKKVAIADGYKKMIIESQNINVAACRFYRKQGAVIAKIDTNAYCSEPGLENEVQLIWTLELK